MSKASWGTKRNCPTCSVAFYDLNKNPALCPKCGNKFDPMAIVKSKRRSTKRGNEEESQVNLQSSILPSRKSSSAKGDHVEDDMADNLNDIMEISDMDDIDNLDELSEIDEIEENSINEDDADEEALIEDLDTGNKNIIGNVEDEEAIALDREIEEEEENNRKTKKKK